MIVYNILLIYIFLISIFFESKNMKIKRNKIVYLCLAFIPLGIVMGFRARTVGADTYAYCGYFREIANVTLNNAIKHNPIIWALLNKFFALFGTKDINYILPLSILINFFIAKFIYENSEDTIFSVILFILGYFYFSAFNGTRQFLALAICINSYKYLLNKDLKERKLKFCIINLIAIGIHPTSIIFLMCLTLLMKPNKKNMVKIFVITIIILGAFVPISNLLVKYFPHYSLYVNEEGITNYGFGVGKNRNFIITMIYMLFEIVMIYIYNNNKNYEQRKKIFSFIVINEIAILLGIMALKSMMFSRIAWYFNIFSIIYIPYVFKYFKANQRNLSKYIYIFIIIIPYYIQLRSNISGVLPYYFIS